MNDRGSLSLELAVLTPALLLLLVVIVAAGRVSLARGAVQAAARDAARQASLARTPGTGQTAGVTAARGTLTQEGVRCTGVEVRVDTSGFAVPLGDPAVVRATVRCQLSLADLAVPGLPGSVTEQAVFTSPLDPYRGR